MLVGNPSTRASGQVPRQLTYTCLASRMTRSGETKEFPKGPCTYGIMVNTRFPTCWDGKTLDPPDHQSHVSYPSSGTFESNGPCPASHPVKIPQVFYEAVFDTRPFNNKADWPEDGSQPFVWSFGDKCVAPLDAERQSRQTGVSFSGRGRTNVEIIGPASAIMATTSLAGRETRCKRPWMSTAA
jgi:hypothetical protein